MLEKYKNIHPTKYHKFIEAVEHKYELDIINQFKDFEVKSEATRVSGGRILE
jgi:transketolase